MHEITLNGRRARPGPAYADGRIALAGLAAENELRVVADCAYATTAKGMHRAVDSADGKVYTYTNFEPADARRVFANFEQPDLKAVFHVPGHRAGALDRAVQPARRPSRSRPATESARPGTFPPTPRISTYLTARRGGRVPRGARRAHHAGAAR